MGIRSPNFFGERPTYFREYRDWQEVLIRVRGMMDHCKSLGWRDDKQKKNHLMLTRKPAKKALVVVNKKHGKTGGKEF